MLQWHAEHAGDKSHIFLATERCASGILEAMKHFDLQPYVSPRDYPVALSVNDKQAPKIGAVAAAHEVVEYLLLIEQWLRGDVPNSHQVHNRLKSVLVGVVWHTPLYPFSFPFSFFLWGFVQHP